MEQLSLGKKFFFSEDYCSQWVVCIIGRNKCLYYILPAKDHDYAAVAKMQDAFLFIVVLSPS